MRKLSGWLIVLVLILCAAAATGEGIPTAQVIGSIEDGAYVLTVKLDPDDAGDWRADEMAQDASVVKLASAETEDGVFTARYEPVSDGAVSVYLRHFNEHTCDRMLGFDLMVKDGKVQEATGGSETGSPSEEDQDPYFSGEWLEKRYAVYYAGRDKEHRQWLADRDDVTGIARFMDHPGYGIL